MPLSALVLACESARRAAARGAASPVALPPVVSYTYRVRHCLLLALAMAAAGLLPSPLCAAEIAVIETIAGSGRGELGAMSGPALEVNINQPFGVESGPDGRIYITEVGHHRLMRFDPVSKAVETVAGNGKQGYTGDGGPATEASMFEPYEVRFDRDGNIFVVEMKGAVVRKIDAKTKTISTIAGNGKPGYGGDGGPARDAMFKQPHSIALDGQGGLYVADIGNHRIRRVDLASGLIETICGNGEAKLPEDGALAKSQPIRGPRALHIVGDVMWIALREGNSIWRLDLKTKQIHHVAGTGKVGAQDGPAKEATFNGPKGIVATPTGLLYVVDTENQTIRCVDTQAGVVTTVAGSGPKGRGFGGDGGNALGAKMDRPHGIGMDAAGVLYIGDTNNHRVRKLTLGKTSSAK